MPQDLEQVIRWQVRKSAPFAIEEAQLGYETGLRADDGQEFIVTLARRDVIAEYEALCARKPARTRASSTCRRSTSSTRCSSAEAVPAGDWLLVNIAPGWESIAIMRGRHLIFFRSRGADGEGTLADLDSPDRDVLRGPPERVRIQPRAAVRRVGGGDVRSVCAADSPSGSATTVETVDPTRAAALRGPHQRRPGGCSTRSTPLVGLILRTREAA